MNPLTQVRRVNAMNAREAAQGVSEAASWHADYRGSAWVFVGGLPYELSEGDIICIFSQYGEVVNLNLVRDKATGKSKGFAFICYEDQRSTNLAVDNFNGIKIKGRTLRVDHVSEYRVPKDHTDTDPVTRALREHGCGPLVPTPTATTPSETPVRPPARPLAPGDRPGRAVTLTNRLGGNASTSRGDGSHEKKQKKKRKKDKKLKKKDKKTRGR
ncbi:RNA-binding motif protein, X-linked 2 [Petromyzon marinus]|uniref:RNA-binding motif protein, X-linked 2 n=1 Tax=Petromyzon marinus TaxID=7757 RepID=UPI003F725F08